MTARLPFNALYAFCTVVRHGGIRPAAQVLCVTPGAVSKQIQLLEDHVKEVLLERLAGNMATPTPAGARLYERVSNAMETISEALEDKKLPARRSTIVVDTSVTLAMHWLIPLLAQFSEVHPGMQVQVRTTDGPINPAAPIDLFIRRDETELRGLPHQTFMVEHSVLVCAPELMVKLGRQNHQDTRWMRRVPRIGMGSRPDLWPKWRRAQNIAAALEPTIEYDNTVLAIQAALQGLGVLVVPEIFVSAMIETKALVLLNTRRVETGAYSYAVKRQRESMRVAKFAEWLMHHGRQSFSTAGVVRR